STPMTREANCSGSFAISVTASVQPESTMIQNSNEPSCAPHTAAIRYGHGSCVLEFCATYSSEKSLTRNAVASASSASSTKPVCPITSARDHCIQAASLRCAPPSPAKVCSRESDSAAISEKCPCSASIS